MNCSGIRVIDSHTCGEPTRVIVEGAPTLEGADVIEKREYMRNQVDWLRTTTVLEPRGHEAIVGAILCQPTRPDCEAGVIFFNNCGYLNGCLHGTMGVAVTLAHLGRIGKGEHLLETPTGVVTIRCGESGQVTVQNVPAKRLHKNVPLEVPGFGMVKGDIAWGGNWFFLTDAPAGIDVVANQIPQLTEYAKAIKKALVENQITGQDGAEIDHIEIFGPPDPNTAADSKNFVLCPGNAFDRSPCGTGTSAKLACLYEDGILSPGQSWKQAGILDTIFEGTVEPHDEGGVIPTVTGTAFVTAEVSLIVHPDDPFGNGIPSMFGS